VFNWNNKITFTHELFNSYTLQMVKVADGISVSFSKNKVIGLKPPTVSDKNLAHVQLPSQSVHTTCFTGPQKLRALIQKMLDDPDCVPKNKLLSLIEEVYLHIECFN